MRLNWDQIGDRKYETGCDRGVLFPVGDAGVYDAGVAWDGLSAVNENPSGGEPTAVYADNIKYLELTGTEEFGATIEAFTYPEAFEVCDGSAEIAPGVTITQQDRKPFGFSYRTLIGNDVAGTNHGYKIHLVYGAKAKPSQKNYGTVNESPEAMTLSWELSTTPVSVNGFKPTSHLIVDSTKVDAGKLKALEDILYGTDEEEARLPLPDEVITLLKA